MKECIAKQMVAPPADAALQNVVWSMSVQYGGAASLVTRAVQQAGPQGSLSNAEYDRKLINQLYAVRNAYVDRLGQPGLKTRYAAEHHDALRTHPETSARTDGLVGCKV